MRTTALLLLVLLVAGGAWFLLAGRDANDDDGEGLERTVDDGSSADLVTLRGRSGAEDLDAASGRDAPEADEPEAAEAESRFLLHGTLLGFDPSRAGVAEIRVHPVRDGWVDHDWRPVDGVAADDGTFDLDVTNLMAYPGDLTHLEVRVDHPAYVQGRIRADVAAARAAGRGVLSVEITLRLGLAVMGEVRSETGTPLTGAAVALFAGRATPSGADAPLVEQAVATVRTDAEGAYRLRVATHGDYRVVAAAEERLPDGALVQLPPGNSARVRPLVLRPGVALAGQVRFLDATVPGVWIKAMPQGHAHVVPMDVGQRAIAWIANGPIPTTGWVQTDEEGHFRLAGLATGPHVLDPSHARSETLPHLTSGAAEALAREVQAPADDLVLEIGGAVVEVCVTGKGRAVEDAEVGIDAGGRGLFVRTDPEGVVRFLVVPTTTCTLSVKKEGFLDAARELAAGAAGTTALATVELQAAVPAPELLVTFTGPHVKALKRASFVLEDPAETGRAAVDRYLRDEEGTGTYRIRELAPGTWRLRMHPGKGVWHAFGYFLPEVREVVVPTQGEVRVEVPLRLGGRLRIAARDADGALLEAWCVIRDASGEELDVNFTAQAESMATESTGVLGSLSPSIVGPPLTPGNYAIELALEDFESLTLVAEVKTNETTEVDVTLTAR